MAVSLLPFLLLTSLPPLRLLINPVASWTLSALHRNRMFLSLHWHPPCAPLFALALRLLQLLTSLCPPRLAILPLTSLLLCLLLSFVVFLRFLLFLTIPRLQLQLMIPFLWALMFPSRPGRFSFSSIFYYLSSFLFRFFSSSLFFSSSFSFLFAAYCPLASQPLFLFCRFSYYS